MSITKIQQVEELIGKKLPYDEGVRLKMKLEAQYNIEITAVPYAALTGGPEDNQLIFSDYKIK